MKKWAIGKLRTKFPLVKENFLITDIGIYVHLTNPANNIYTNQFGLVFRLKNLPVNLGYEVRLVNVSCTVSGNTYEIIKLNDSRYLLLKSSAQEHYNFQYPLNSYQVANLKRVYQIDQDADIKNQVQQATLAISIEFESLLGNYKFDYQFYNQSLQITIIA